MLSPGFADALHRSDLARRASVRPDGQVSYRCADGSGHVLASQREWHAQLASYDARLKPIKRRTRWLSIALFPGILVFGMTIGQVVPFAGVMILAAMFGGPLLIYLAHSRAVQRIAAEVDGQLAAGEPCEAPARSPLVLPRWFEIAFLLLVGPDLLLSVAGEIGGPDLFRGTPLWGTELGTTDYVAAALIGVRLLWPRLGGSLPRKLRES
ncbi:hypothetical protein [Sphingomonas sp.]|jgi:hypothetical protein|uniref:hypothetical protein n=1 Tax=Sphingomonas sp. TaxID=28214 RepID=UPI002D7E848B|nr:hypothetical protein [Sphingomonas sp.]HEU0043909.1 hypothetical protein [Sphingomonas sp.]